MQFIHPYSIYEHPEQHFYHVTHNGTVCLDDGIVNVESEQTAKLACVEVRDHFEKSGFACNIEKSHWGPTQTLA